MKFMAYVMAFRMMAGSLYLKIRRSIIGSSFISMMHDFVFCKEASNFFFHYKTMFVYISSRITSWVVRFIDLDVSVTGSSPTFPSPVKLSPIPISRNFRSALERACLLLCSFNIIGPTIKLFSANEAFNCFHVFQYRPQRGIVNGFRL